jgi:hypothetical protein
MPRKTANTTAVVLDFMDDGPCLKYSDVGDPHFGQITAVSISGFAQAEQNLFAKFTDTSAAFYSRLFSAIRILSEPRLWPSCLSDNRDNSEDGGYKQEH